MDLRCVKCMVCSDDSGPFPAGPADYPSGQRAGMLTVAEDLHAVHKDMLDSGRVLVGPVECRPVTDRIGIEHDDIREVSCANQSALADLEVGRREGCESPYPFLQ